MADLAIAAAPPVARTNGAASPAPAAPSGQDDFMHVLAAARKPAAVAMADAATIPARAPAPTPAASAEAGDKTVTADGKASDGASDDSPNGTLDPALVALLASLQPAPAVPTPGASVPAVNGAKVAAMQTMPETTTPAGDVATSPVSPEKQALAAAALAALGGKGVADPAVAADAPQPPPPRTTDAAPGGATAAGTAADARQIQQAASPQAESEQDRRDRQTPAHRAHAAQIAPDALATAAPNGIAATSTSMPDAGALLASPADQTVDRAVAGAHEARNLDMLARDIAATTGADAQLNFRLSPEHLGGVSVHIAQSADGASVRMSADTDRARNILADAQPRLAAEARAQGLTLRETSVDVGGGQNAPRGGGGHGLAGQAGDGQAGQRGSSPDQNPSRPIVAPVRTERVAAKTADARYA